MYDILWAQIINSSNPLWNCPDTFPEMLIEISWVNNKRGMAIQVADPERARGRRGHQDLQHARQVLQPQRRLQGTQGSGK